MTDLHDALVAYTADEPPASFTYDQVLTAGRRARRRRRATAAGIAAVAATVLAAGLPHPVAAPLTPAGPSSAPSLCDAPDVLSGDPTSVVTGTNGYRMKIPAEPAARTADRLSCYLTRSVPEAMRGFTFLHDPAAPAGKLPLPAFPPRVFEPARPGDRVPPVVTASAEFGDENGAGELGFGLSPRWQDDAAAIAGCTGACSVRSGPKGEVATVHEATGANGYRSIGVTVYCGETVVLAVLTNGERADPAAVPQPGRADLPITVDELIRLASAPQLALFP